MTANNKDKRKRTKKSGVFKRLEQKREIREWENFVYEGGNNEPVSMALDISTMIAVPVFLRDIV